MNKIEMPPRGNEELPRALGLFDATLMVMGGIVGAGIFFTTQGMAISTPSVFWILVAWGLGGLIALAGAVVFAELGGLLPHAGGQYVFLREALGRFPAFLFGWMLFAVITSGALAVVAGVCVDHLAVLLDVQLSDLGRKAVGAALLALTTLVNIRGVRLGATVHNVVMLSKIAAISLIVVFGISHFFSGEAPVQSPPTSSFGIGGFAAAMLAVAFSYGGWQNVCAIAGEVRNPQKTIPLAILLGTVFVCILYLSVNWSYLSTLGVEGVASSKTFAADTAHRVVGPWGRSLIAAFIVISTVGILQALLLMIPRIYYAMARDGLFFKTASILHPRFRTPWVAITALGSWSIVLVVVGKAGWLLDSVVFADWVFFFLCGVAYFVLRKRRPNDERPFKAVGHPWIPGFFLLASAGLVIGSIIGAHSKDQIETVLYGVGFIALGSACYPVWRSLTKERSCAGS